MPRIPTVPMFYTAAAFNLLAGLAMLIAPGAIYAQMTGGPPPASTGPIMMFGLTVAMFGVGYIWAARDFAANRAIVKLGAIGKALAFVVAVIAVLMGELTVSALGGTSIDLLYAILFWDALARTRR